MTRRVVVIDHGLGNMRSVLFACAAVGLDVQLTADPTTVRRADGVILPGVGAFGDAMAALRRAGLDEAIHQVIEAGRPLLGICLGLQLLASSSEEFGEHDGLGIVPGTVVRLRSDPSLGRNGRVPTVGWQRVQPGPAWSTSPLSAVRPGTFMYFVHSFHLEPNDPSVVAATSEHAGTPYCSAVSAGNVFACQFHPERSGRDGLRIYRRIFELREDRDVCT